MIEQGKDRSSLLGQVTTLLAELDDQLIELRALLLRYLTPIALGVGELPAVVVVNSRLCDAMSLESNQWIEKDVEVRDEGSAFAQQTKKGLFGTLLHWGEV